MLCYRKPSVFVSGPMFVVFAVLLYLTPLISELFINFQAIFIILLFVIFVSVSQLQDCISSLCWTLLLFLCGCP